MMKMKKIMATGVAMLILGSAVGCDDNVSSDSESSSENTGITDEKAQTKISNSYENTKELIRKFPVINPTPIDTELGKDIQNRLLNGFENWNRGYDAWKAWGDILYTEDSLYNVHGVKLTLKEYQDSMNETLKASDIQMGNFNNMIVSGDWAAIRYDISTINRKTREAVDGSVMEFVRFKDYGDKLGTRVVEGWAGTKGSDFAGLSSFQTEEEKAAQQAELEKIINTSIPDTSNLEEKYPVVYPTSIDTEMAKKIQRAILNDFDNWNQGYDAWTTWADTYYDSNMQYHTSAGTMTLEKYKAAVKDAAESTDVKRIYFDNMLISGDWAAIHYRITNLDLTTGEKTAGDVMQFLHFVEDGNGVKVVESWTK